jgi:uncharacterized protein involved in tolerance to divalent cations
MINLVIYLDRLNEAKDLVTLLLKEGLIANASIDHDNVSYRMQDGELQKTVNSVITAQTRSMLFLGITKLIEEHYGEHVPVYSMPITQANASFDQLIRDHTKLL